MCCSWLRTNYTISVIFSVAFVLLLLLILNFLRFRRLRRRRRRNVDVDLLDFIIDLIAEQNNEEDRPLDRNVLATLPKSRYCQDENSGEAPPDCVICLSPFEEGEMVKTLPNCNHIFHADCIDMWLYSHSKCPVCRAQVDPAAASSDPSMHELEESTDESSNENDHGRSRSSSRCSPERNDSHCVIVVEDGDGRSK